MAHDPKLAQKQAVGEAALAYIPKGAILGVGTGSTVNCLIEKLAGADLKGAVASSKATEQRLAAVGVEVLDLNSVGELDLYIDGADEIAQGGAMIKGGGGALTREKIVAAASKRFICLADDSKWKQKLGAFPVAVEVLDQARSYVARRLVELGGYPVYRDGFVSDYGNAILDTYDLPIDDPKAWEEKLNNIVGVVCHGIFAHQTADLLLMADKAGVRAVSFEKA